MVRSCVDRWLVVYVKKLVKNHGFGAHDLLFQSDGTFPDGFFDAITAHLKVDKPVLHGNIKARVFAVTKYNGNAEEVEAVLSM